MFVFSEASNSIFIELSIQNIQNDKYFQSKYSGKNFAKILYFSLCLKLKILKFPKKFSKNIFRKFFLMKKAINRKVEGLNSKELKKYAG